MFAVRHRRDHGPKRRGAAAVEFAVTAPILFIIFFAMIEFARFNMIRHGIDCAVYEGARRGIVPGATVNDVQGAATSILNAVSAIDGSVTVVPGALTPETTQVTVTVSVPSRNIHSQVGMINLSDFQNTVELMYKTLCRMAELG